MNSFIGYNELTFFMFLLLFLYIRRRVVNSAKSPKRKTEDRPRGRGRFEDPYNKWDASKEDFFY